MNKTTNFNLALFENGDKFNITQESNSFNANMKKIDASLKNLDDKIVEVNNRDVTNALRGKVIIDGTIDPYTIDDFSPIPQELTIKCTRFAWDTYAALIVMDGDQYGTTLYPDEDGYCRGFFADGNPITFMKDQGDFQIEYNKDINKVIENLENQIQTLLNIVNNNQETE